MSYELQVGDTVRCVSNINGSQWCKGKIGKIIYKFGQGKMDRRVIYSVEFFEHVDGHDGNGYGKGKKGYCWNFFEEDIKVYLSILKIFLKEKKNEI